MNTTSRISKMPVQNSNFKISARSDLPTNLLKILILTHLIAYCVKKGTLHFNYVQGDGLLVKYLVITSVGTIIDYNR